MRLLLVDDERLLLAAVTRALRRERPAWVVDTAPDGVEALRLLRSRPVDLLISDVQMPAMDGMALLRAVRQDPELAKLPLILISAQDDRSAIRTGMASGADDYLTKPFTAEELILAVESRLRRLEPGVDNSAQALALRAELKGLLTEREWEVLAQIGQGLVTKDIAATLKLSPKTVSVHRQNLMGKLDLHNAAALAALAIRASIS
jgi:DNA-binding NarL/FixJ family response regulator